MDNKEQIEEMRRTGFSLYPIKLKYVEFYAPFCKEKKIHKYLLCSPKDAGNYRIYYSPYDRNKLDGFVFCVTKFHEGDDTSLDHEVEIVLQGWGFFDGIRHLITNDQNYPDIEAIIKVYKELHKLQMLYCSEGRWFDSSEK